MTQDQINKLKAKALQQFREGKSMFRKGGAFAGLVKEVVQAAVEAEIEHHLGTEEREKGNKRNGYKEKTMKTTEGDFVLKTPQDRHNSFEPQIVKKRQTVIADNMEQQIILLYAKGMSLRLISDHIGSVNSFLSSSN